VAKNATAVRGRTGRAGGPSAGTDRTIKELTRVFKSLADEHRLQILFLLARHGEMNVSAIGDELGQSQPAVSHHLTQLRNAGLIEYRRDGKFNFYDLNPDGMAELLDHMFPVGPARLVFGGVEVSFKRK
jgi:ArsR family transcriptional regulator, arsenate/arsenite/antimonite-responsive transcriptional repressor